VSGNGTNYGNSPFPNGVVAFSRILNNEEVVVVANTNTVSTWDGHIVIDRDLHPLGRVLGVLYGNQGSPPAPGAVTDRPPYHTIHVRLRPMEVQVLGITR
jgi:hypothetical protein